MKTKHLSYQSLFATWRLQIGAILGIVIYFWALFFLPEPTLAWITHRVETAGKVLAPILPILGTSAVSIVFLFLVGEPLIHGRSRAALYYQAQFPSKKLAEKFNVDAGTASDYFLRYYDCWQFDTQTEHLDYLHTTQLRFWCLFDYLGRRLLIGLLALSVGGFFYYVYVQNKDTAGLMAQLIFILTLLVLLGAFIVFNRLPSPRNSQPNGCWKAWKEQCDRNYRAYLEALGNQAPEEFHKRNKETFQELINASKG